MSISVFYSWQSDLPSQKTKRFIHEAAEDAISQLGKKLRLEEAPRLDHSTAGVSGVPSIGDTILRRIDECAIFLADVSFVGRSHPNGNGKSKLLPNPNVLLELGYALGRIGWKRIILVMNTEFGPEDELPFDLKYRRFPFSFGKAKGDLERNDSKKELTKYLTMAMQSIILDEHQLVTDVIKRLDGPCLHLMSMYAKSTHFWETDPADNPILTREIMSIYRLLELNLIECVTHPSQPGFAYRWTYLGTLVLDRLKFAEFMPGRAQQAESYSTAGIEPVLDLSSYEMLGLPMADEDNNE